MDISKGQFWDKGVTLVPGCTKCSPGCLHCWSESLGRRFPTHPNRAYLDNYSQFTGRVGWRLDLLKKALRSRKDKVLALWNDFYHEGITHAQRGEALGLILSAQKTVIICTKRPHIAADFWRKWPADDEIIRDKIFHLFTVENQEMFDKRIPDILKVPGKKGLLIEPMLGPVRIAWECLNYTNGSCRPVGEDFCNGCYHSIPIKNIHAVIVGAETGAGMRYLRLDWAQAVVDQCKAASVPVFVKQLHINGKAEKDINKFPASLSVRELPWLKETDK